jgi:endonuclease YncB( thermonuclease family)
MPQGLLEVNGTIEVIQFWPEGRSDADTAKVVVTIGPDSVRFRENKARPFRVTHFLDGATVGIPVNGRRKLAVNAKGQLTIRLQGIDAPELHFQPSALEASEFPGLDQAGFAAVKKQYHDAKVVHPYRQLLGATTTKALHDFLASAGSSTLPCRAFTQVDLPNEVFDKYGRMVADIEVTIGGNTVSINEWAVQTGSAFPAFYSSMSDTEITTLRGLGNTARSKELGVWKHLAKTIDAFDFTLLEPKKGDTSVLATDAGPVIFPKLYRRQTNWAARNKAAVSNATLQQFLEAQKKDQCYRTDDFLANGDTRRRNCRLRRWSRRARRSCSSLTESSSRRTRRPPRSAARTWTSFEATSPLVTPDKLDYHVWWLPFDWIGRTAAIGGFR